jgi:hypothetical protein
VDFIIYIFVINEFYFILIRLRVHEETCLRVYKAAMATWTLTLVRGVIQAMSTRLNKCCTSSARSVIFVC